MKKRYVMGIVPLLGLIVPVLALGFALRKGGRLTKAGRLSESDHLVFY